VRFTSRLNDLLLQPLFSLQAQTVCFTNTVLPTSSAFFVGRMAHICILQQLPREPSLSVRLLLALAPPPRALLEDPKTSAAGMGHANPAAAPKN
jgi:hypothetical protein